MFYPWFFGGASHRVKIVASLDCGASVTLSDSFFDVISCYVQTFKTSEQDVESESTLQCVLYTRAFAFLVPYNHKSSDWWYSKSVFTEFTEGLR